MSLPPIHPFAGAAASGLDDRRQLQHQREQKIAQTKVETQSSTDAEARAAAAANDRDGDGRQAWQQAGEQESPENLAESSQAHENDDRHDSGETTIRNIDPARGQQLDLEG